MSERLLRAVRGATTLEEDTREQMVERIGELLTEILGRNGLEPDDLVSIIFTATGDLRSEFAATAARAAGIADIPLLGAREVDVEGAVERCVRVLAHAYTERGPDELRHVYLHGARELRLDLSG